MVPSCLPSTRTVGLPVTLLLAVAVPAGGAVGKTRIEKLDDLPRRTYEISGTASDLLASDEPFSRLAAKVKADLLDLLDTYEVEDANTRQRIYETLQGIAFLEGDYQAALAYLEEHRALEGKEAARLTAGLIAEAYVGAISEAGDDPGSERFRGRYGDLLREAVRSLPWRTVQEKIEQMKGQMEMFNENLIRGLVASQIDPAVAKSGFLSSDQAGELIGLRSAIAIVIPVREKTVEVLSEAIAANRIEKPNIWTERNVILAEQGCRARVRVGVWDTGVDVDLYPNRIVVNRGEKPNGLDDDGNGFVDDVTGIAYDRNHDRSPEILYLLGEAIARRTELEDQIKGFFDLQASIDSPEAAKIKQRFAGLQPNEVQAFFEDLMLYAHHCHGTHVAGIAVEGNPCAEIVIARLGTDHRLIPDPPAIEMAHKLAREFQETVDYFRSTGTRVVNMSWVMSVKEFEGDLEKNGIGEDAEARGGMAREIFSIAKEGLHAAFRSAPGILFVGGAGNSDNDVDFDEFIPPAFDLPNLLIAGAVDQAGDATDFTSFGRSVGVYSNGFEVESYVPGGRRMKLSGTSMASPNVVNLAAKLLAIDPSLTPLEVIELIKAGAEDRGEGSPMPVIDPERSVELLRQRIDEER